MRKTKQKDPPLLINRAAAAFQLGISPASLDVLVKTRQLPAVRIGARVLFLRSVLLEFALSRLDQRRPKPKDGSNPGGIVACQN